MDYLLLLLLTRITQNVALLGLWGCGAIGERMRSRFWGENAIAFLQPSIRLFYDVMY
ncbi:hypothetical protein H6F74_27030 [Trichocoleus sp. FACHB-90]|uniref:hypothetical protein n=1 Tax=Cyanophyceae TaxID=3028117 RepID=UPI001688B1AD|nr:hypothetical protein [Trichocoleus sp. FACHB-90]MBD1929859.1 hypothetical protein [Trichocoleus sp. FACHB-90]